MFAAGDYVTRMSGEDDDFVKLGEKYLVTRIQCNGRFINLFGDDVYAYQASDFHIVDAEAQILVPAQ